MTENPHSLPRTTDDPMGGHIVHHLLVNTQKLQRIPAPAVAGIIAVLLLAVGLAHGVAAGVIGLLTAYANWGILWALPRAGKSFGPDRPSALVLAVMGALIGVALGLLNAPLIIFMALCLICVSLVYYSTWIEPFRLDVTHEALTVSAWPDSAPPVRLLHIADIHIERITDRERRLNELIRELQPDVIVFSGDFVNISYNDDPQTEADIRAIISQWEAPLGVYCVGGTYTVEPWERVQAFCAGLDNLRLLHDEWVTIPTAGGDLNILGMQTTHRTAQDAATLERLAASLPAGVNVLLTHAPDVAPVADALGFDLYVCGHTHGGQLRAPFIGAIFTGSAYGRLYAMGRRDLPRTVIYTSRGVGMEGMGAPRARLLCPPEIILWEIGGA